MIGIDSNLLIYAVVRSDDGRRHDKTVRVLDALVERQQLFLPLQAVGESFHVLVRKLRLPPREAMWLTAGIASFAVVQLYDSEDVQAAMSAVGQNRLSFWDALIWAVCQRSGVRTLLTKDMQDGRILGQVTFMNPFGEQAAHLLGH